MIHNLQHNSNIKIIMKLILMSNVKVPNFSISSAKRIVQKELNLIFFSKDSYFYNIIVIQSFLI